jgi:hypothetical protein
MSHAKKGGVTHIGVTPISMNWLILGTERWGRAAQIDVATDGFVAVSHVRVFGGTQFKNTPPHSVWPKGPEVENNLWDHFWNKIH